MAYHELPSAAARSIRISAVAEQPVLSAPRKRFNALVRRLENCRGRLQAWNEALPRWRERYHEQVEPLAGRRVELEVEQLELLDRAHAIYKLGKAERAFLSELICDIAGPLIMAGREALKPLYDRHSELGFDDEVADSEQWIKQAIGEQFGLEPDELADIDSPEALFERVQARQREQAEHARAREQRSRSRRAQRSKSAAVSEQVAPPPLRELYRRLATTLHPDRESDPDERERKTSLMQRLNQAYQAGNLLGLIELQLEIGQLRPEQLQQMSDARIKEYNRDLDTQLQRIESELVQVEESFRGEYPLGVDRRPDPRRLDALMAQIKRALAGDIQLIEADMRALQQPATFRQWLKRAREQAEQERRFSDDLDAALW